MQKQFSKRAQGLFGISFGMVFSIIIIIFIIAVAIYAITYFLGLNKCTQVGLFFQDMQEEIDKAWHSQYYSAAYEGSLPASGILKLSKEQVKVCFGSLNQNTPRPSTEDNAIQDKLESDYFANEEHNIFIYPPDSVCSELYSTKLKRVKPDIAFFCADVDKTKNKVRVMLKKDFSEPLVSIGET